MCRCRKYLELEFIVRKEVHGSTLYKEINRKYVTDEMSNAINIAKKKSLYDEIDTIYKEHGVAAFDIVWLREHYRSLAFGLTGMKISMKELADRYDAHEEAQARIQKIILDEWKKLLEVHGLNALAQRWLEKNKLIGILRRAQRNGLSLKDVTKALGQEEALKDKIDKMVRNGDTRWTAEQFDRVAKVLVEEFGCIPPADYLKQNGYGGFHWQIKNFGPGIDDVRKRLGVQNVKLVDMEGNVWLSLPEVAMSNYLLARGIPVSKGMKYPKEYSDRFPRSYGVYDLHFKATVGKLQGREIKVEIWRSTVGRDADNKYSETRKFKEEFHKSDSSFLGIEFADCYSEIKLQKLLISLIGKARIIRQHPMFKVPSNMISIMDQLVAECKNICDKLPEGDNKLPSCDWFARSKAYSSRTVYDWEPQSWGRMIGHLGRIGYRNMRLALRPWHFKMPGLDTAQIRINYGLTYSL